MAVHVALELKLQDGKADEFIGLLAKAFEETRTKEGFIDIVATQSIDDPNTVLLWETWESAEHYDAYFNWRVETGFMDAIGPFVAAPPSKRLFNPVA